MFAIPQLASRSVLRGHGISRGGVRGTEWVKPTGMATEDQTERGHVFIYGDIMARFVHLLKAS